MEITINLDPTESSSCSLYLTQRSSLLGSSFVNCSSHNPLISLIFVFFFYIDSDKYCAGHATEIPFNVNHVASLTMIVTLTLQAELYSVTQACTLARVKSATIYIECIYISEVVHDFGML